MKLELKANRPLVVREPTKKELGRMVKKCLDISPARLSHFDEEVARFPNETLFVKMMDDSTSRTAAYGMVNNS